MVSLWKRRGLTGTERLAVNSPLERCWASEEKLFVVNILLSVSFHGMGMFLCKESGVGHSIV